MKVKIVPARQRINIITVLLLSLLHCLLSPTISPAATMNDYCIMPPFVAQAVPPMVMFDVSRDHKLYYQAYNDGVDLNGDGRIDNMYDHSIEYYGYFNPYKCYTHTGGSSSNDYFTPATTNTDRFCASGQWGGNILNWLTMSRMDVIRKVMYGGQRSQETPKVLLNRAYIPQDAHSWGKEFTGKLCGSGSTYKQMCIADADCDSGYTCQDKSINLIGIAAPTAGTPCTTAPGFASNNSDPGYQKMLAVRYPNTNGTNDTNHATLLAGFDTTQFYTGFTPTFVTDFSDTIFIPSNDHGDNYAQIVVAEFSTGGKCNNNCGNKNQGGDWTFAIDGDDGVELEIRKVSDGQILQSKNGNNQLGWYGGHGWCSDCKTHTDKWTLANSSKYRVIVRHTEGGGQDGVKLWYKTPDSSSTWQIFGQSSIITVNAPKIVTSGASDNTCSLKNDTFRDTGVPTAVSTTTGQGYHLFCNTTLSAGVPSSSAASQTTILRRITDSKHRIWEWTLKERPVCDDSFEDGSSATTNRTDFTVQAEVCKSGVGTLSEKNLFERCRNYGGTYTAATDTYTGGTWMPIGLFQKYGEYNPNDPSGITRVCSKTMGKSCSTDNDCDSGEGLCFDKSQMYFGAMTTTYTKNTSGGVLRKNPGPVSDEVNMNNGTQQTSENVRGNLIHSMDRMVVIDFDYSSHSYSNCGWIWDRPINEGECKMWGNPLAEMMYETLRYFAGKNSPTAAYSYSTTADSGVNLSKPDWGYTKGSTVYKPFDIFPSCSQPFTLLLSDVNTSYDADQIPGSSYSGTFAEDTLAPHLGLGDTLSNGKTVLNDLMDTISTTEGIDGNSWFIGESGGSTDFICSPKTATNLRGLRGTCPEEPTKKGSYYAAALAYYGKTKFHDVTGFSPVSTFVVALSSPFADISIKAGNNKVKIVPVAKTVSGTTSKCLGYGGCTYTTDASGRLIFSNCPSDAFCPTNSLVGLFINDIKYNSSNEIIYMKFRQNFEDVEQGADHDMDAIATYEVCTSAAATANYGSCASLSLATNEFEVLVTSSYAAGGADQVLGYIISGTTADGTYLVVKDKDIGSGSPIYGLPLESKLEFTSSSTPSANNLKNPLWYAAKWGGFTGSGKPDTPAKWDKDNDGNPDNYFPVSNPLELDKQLENALLAILARVSSGTAASILNNSEGSGASLLQAIFYPKKTFDNQTSSSWSGELMNLWYYVDPFFALSTIREDTDYTTGNHIMDIDRDKRIQFYFDNADSQTKIKRTNFDGSVVQADFNADVTGGLKTIWTAGKLLWKRDIATGADPRKMYTTIDSKTFTDFNLANASLLSTRLNAEGADATAKTVFAGKVIDYVLGTDICLDSSSPCNNKSRNRTVDIKVSDTATESHVWKLGDIISSTPKIQGGVPLQSYDLKPPLGYEDSTYKDFYLGANYKNRGMVYVGANDGMLHAFKLGKMSIQNLGTQKATLSGTNLGREEWTYIPKHAMPYLKYLTLPDYDNNHLYLVDGTNALFDVSTKTAAVRDDYWNETRTASTWKTVLLGGMGLGGASKAFNNTCSAGTAAGTCVKAPFDTVHGFSSYFAIDVTDQDFNQDSANLLRTQPTLLWEFSHPELGYSTSGPAIVRLNSKNTASPFAPQPTKNGRWFAVYASGPTGPIDTTSKQFKGKSDQNLKLFVVDMEKGPVVDTDPKKNGLWIIDTGITEAFAGSISNNAVVDAEMSDSKNENLKQDDVLYVGYTQKASDGTWTNGGILRLVIPDSTNPDTMDMTAWKTSKVIDGVGPVTTTVSKLMSANNLYLFFGTGRYFYPQDDMTSTRRLFMVKEKCFPVKDSGGNFVKSDIITTCDSTNSAISTLTLSDLTPKNTPSNTAVANGWYIDLDVGERVVTDTVATVNGAVFYTTYKPTSDVCGFGGKSYLWGVKYDTGGALPASAKKGKILIQLSTGSFAEMDLTSVLTEKGGRRTEETSDLSFGKASADPGLFMTSAGLTPVKRILHIQERFK